VLVAKVEGKTRREGYRAIGLLLLACALVLGAAPAWGAEPYRIEPVELRASDELPRALADKLDLQGLRLVTESNGLEMGICELFWAKAAMGQDHRPGAKAHYGDLETGALVGVIRFLPEASEDFREDSHDQKLKPGYYTMRYAALPEMDGQDVVLLSPAKGDAEAEQTLALDELKRRSRLASGTHEPAALTLVPPESGKAEFPAIRMDDQGTCIIQVRFQVRVGPNPAHEVPFAMMVVTPHNDEGGS